MPVVLFVCNFLQCGKYENEVYFAVMFWRDCFKSNCYLVDDFLKKSLPHASIFIFIKSSFLLAIAADFRQKKNRKL